MDWNLPMTLWTQILDYFLPSNETAEVVVIEPELDQKARNVIVDQEIVPTHRDLTAINK